MEKQIEIPKFCASPKTMINMPSADYTKLIKCYRYTAYAHFIIGFIIGFSLCALCLVVTAG